MIVLSGCFSCEQVQDIYRTTAFRSLLIKPVAGNFLYFLLYHFQACPSPSARVFSTYDMSKSPNILWLKTRSVCMPHRRRGDMPRDAKGEGASATKPLARLKDVRRGSRLEQASGLRRAVEKIIKRGWLCRALFSQTFFLTVSCCASPWKRRALLTDDFEQPIRLAIAGTEPSSITRTASSFLSRSFAWALHVGIMFLSPLRFRSP